MADRRLIRAIPTTVVALIVAAGLIWVATGHWRRGAVGLGSAAGVAAILRLLVRDGSIGPLAVRSRVFDVTFLTLLTIIFAVATTVGF